MPNANDITAKLYDAVYAPLKGREITDAEISLITSIIPPNSKILDIGVGTGRHYIPLTTLGYDVIGLDSSEGMLDELLLKMPMAKVFKRDVLSYNFEGDKFDLIIMMWNAFNEIVLNTEDAKNLLTHFKSILVPGGKVLINSDDPAVTKMYDQDFNLSSIYEGDEYQVNWKSLSYDEPKQTTVSLEHIKVFDKDKNLIEDKSTEITQRWWSEEQYKELASENGFRFERLHLPQNNELYIVFTSLEA